MKSLLTKTGLLMTVLALAACAGMPTNDLLQEAHAIYKSAEGDPMVARVASTELRAAKDELENAEELLHADAPVAVVEHHAYLAKRHAQIAKEQAKRASMQEQIETFSEKREQLLMAAQVSQTQSAEARAAALQRKLAAMEAEKTDRGMVLTLGDVLFELNESDLLPGGVQVVEELARFLKDYPERTVLIEGYTDSTGSSAYNQQLSEARARSVKQALMQRGISPSRIMTIGYGEQYPVASNETLAGRQLNRRVEIVISDAQGHVEQRK